MSRYNTVVGGQKRDRVISESSYNEHGSGGAKNGGGATPSEVLTARMQGYPGLTALHPAVLPLPNSNASKQNIFFDLVACITQLLSIFPKGCKHNKKMAVFCEC